MNSNFTDGFVPRMSGKEIDCYLRHLSHADAVLEYGVGGSTVLAAEQNVNSLVSIDTDPNWVAKVSEHHAVASMISAGKARLIHVDLGQVGDWGYPKSSQYMYRWPTYARRPWWEGFKPNLALVDGRFRISCIMQCLLNGGPDLKIVVHDFWDRPFYHNVLRYADVIDRADTLAVLTANRRKWWFATVLRLRHEFDPG